MSRTSQLAQRLVDIVESVLTSFRVHARQTLLAMSTSPSGVKYNQRKWRESQAFGCLCHIELVLYKLGEWTSRKLEHKVFGARWSDGIDLHFMMKGSRRE